MIEDNRNHSDHFYAIIVHSKGTLCVLQVKFTYTRNTRHTYKYAKLSSQADKCIKLTNPSCSMRLTDIHFLPPESQFRPGKCLKEGEQALCRKYWRIFVGNYKIAAKLYCRLTQKMTDEIATLTKPQNMLRTFTSTIKSRKCYIKIRPMKLENFD